MDILKRLIKEEWLKLQLSRAQYLQTQYEQGLKAETEKKLFSEVKKQQRVNMLLSDDVINIIIILFM